ncbi:MAG TPA: hypothetical protein VIF57_21540 [Polyangia bacterium]|jgi:hypothetical protein
MSRLVPSMLLASALAAAAPAAAQTAGVQAAPPPPPAQPERLPMRLALQTEGAIGLYPGDFYNHLVGARVDLVFSPHVSFGGYAGYANLKGKDGRVSDLLAYVQAEYVIGPPGGVRIPLRFASGYLPRNGPVVRAAAGFAFPLAPALDLVTELLAPMVWVTRDQMVLSMNLAAEIAYRF